MPLPPPPPPPAPRAVKARQLLILAAVVATLSVFGWVLPLPGMANLCRSGAVLGGLFLVGWLFLLGLRKLLYSVGRRLAFSYFLIGVLPIPMLMVIGGGTLYILLGFFQGYRYKEGLRGIETELAFHARSALADRALADRTLDGDGDNNIAWLRYSEQQLVAQSTLSGWLEAPQKYPHWIAGLLSENALPLVMIGDRPTVVVVEQRGKNTVLALFQGDLEAELAERTGIWTRFLKATESGGDGLSIEIGESKFLQPLNKNHDTAERQAFFSLGATEAVSWAQRPLIYWGEVASSVPELSQPDAPPIYLVASLNGTLENGYSTFFSTAAEIDAVAWGSLIALTSLLAIVYGVALMMALLIIYRVGRAVNLLSKGTAAVQAGRFDVRIPAKRHDQLGTLQRSFNNMTANLKGLIEEGAQREALEKELAIAHDLQQSLLPRSLPQTDQVTFSALFEPSAAIGGDYFDMLELDDGRLGIIVADVSGHGLSTGLRMAMFKATLGVLVEERHSPEDILRRLHRFVKAERRNRYFVTATFAILDPGSGVLELFNAGHPPTYILRNGTAREIVLPGSPLGGLGEEHGYSREQLETGDFVVLMSDGFVETTDADDEPFGFDRLQQLLSTTPKSPGELKRLIVDQVLDHAGGVPANDDRTLVVLQYENSPDTTAEEPQSERPSPAPSPAPSASSNASPSRA